MRPIGLFVMCVLVVASGASRNVVKSAVARERHAAGHEEGPKCGSWQTAYSQLHKNITSGEQPGRYAISVPAPAGLSDRLVGLVTVFLYALLTDRAFQIAGAPNVQSLERVYSQPNINWTISETSAKLWTPGKEKVSGESWEYIELLNADHEGGQKGEMLQVFEEKPLTSLGLDKDTVFIEVNRGRSVRLFSNPHHKAQLEGLGLTYATAFGCSIEYLFQPLPQTLEQVVPEMRKIKEPNTFTIGIQIRMGDDVLLDANRYVNISQPQVAQYFSCAQQIQDTLPRALWRHRVQWLLVTDSASLREAAVEMFGQKLLTKLDVSLGHSFIQSKHEKAPGQSFLDVDEEAFQTAAAEQFLLGMADAHVISWDSSFGRTAAFRAMNPEGWLFDLSLKNPFTSCKLGIDHTPFEVTSRHYAGIRHMYT